jgi:hypothetical protein
MDILGFLEHSQSDFLGRTLEDIWSLSDSEIESTHDFIQLVFPLNEPSLSSYHGVHLTCREVEQIRGRLDIQKNLLRSAEWILGFLERSLVWRGAYNHNQLRITRVIKSLRLLVSHEAADRFHHNVLQMVGDGTKVNQKALEFWASA